MKVAGLLGDLRQRHTFPIDGRAICQSGEDVGVGREIAEYFVPGPARAVQLSGLPNASVGDTIAAGTEIANEGSWLRGRPILLDYDARVVALNEEAGQVFLAGESGRRAVRANLTGTVLEHTRPGQITLSAPGFSLWCPLAFGGEAFGTLALAPDLGAALAGDYPGPAIAAIADGSALESIEQVWPANLNGLIAPSLPVGGVLAHRAGLDSNESLFAHLAEPTLGFSEGLGTATWPDALAAILRALAGNPACLLPANPGGYGQLLVSGPIPELEFDDQLIRGLASSGFIYGTFARSPGTLHLRPPGGPLIPAAAIACGDTELKIAPLNGERIVVRARQ